MLELKCQSLPASRRFMSMWRLVRGTETLIVNLRGSREGRVEVWLFRDESGEPAEVHVVDEATCEAWLLEKKKELLAAGWH